MKTQYIQIKGKKFAVKTRQLKTGSNYNTGLSVHNIGEKMPICGTIIKDSDNVKQWAIDLINNLSPNVAAERLIN